MKYPFEVIFEKNGVDTYWLAKSKILNHVIGKGETPEEAIQLLSEMEDTWLEFCENANEIPKLEPIEPNEYSGKISLRLSKQTHALAAKAADEQGVSLNQYICEAVIYRNAVTNTCDRLLELYASRKAESYSSITQESNYNFKRNYRELAIQETTYLKAVSN
jgi:predicted HicB family RNase H-like nuclease